MNSRPWDPLWTPYAWGLQAMVMGVWLPWMVLAALSHGRAPVPAAAAAPVAGPRPRPRLVRPAPPVEEDVDYVA